MQEKKVSEPRTTNVHWADQSAPGHTNICVCLCVCVPGMSGVSGAGLWEVSCINRSLSALSDVLGALAEQRPHVPYRNSKLTHLLQDAIGDAHTCTHISFFFFMTYDSCFHVFRLWERLKPKISSSSWEIPHISIHGRHTPKDRTAQNTHWRCAARYICSWPEIWK